MPESDITIISATPVIDYDGIAFLGNEPGAEEFC